MNFTEGLEAAWQAVALFLPKLLGALLILVVGFIIAKALQKATNALLERVGFDRAVERGGVRRALEKTPYDASDMLAKLVYYAVALFTLQLAFGLFGPNPVSEVLTGIIGYLPNIFAAILIVVVAGWIASAVKDLVAASLSSLNYGDTIATIASVAVVTVGVFAALNQLQIAPAIVTGLFYALLVAVVGIAVVAVGGAGIQPMRSRWENVLDRYDEEKPKVKAAAKDDTTSTSTPGPRGARDEPVVPRGAAPRPDDGSATPGTTRTIDTTDTTRTTDTSDTGTPRTPPR